MGFKITKDYTGVDAILGESFNAVGTVGPSNIRIGTHRLLNEGAGIPFKMYDDDGELYYEGLWIEDERENRGQFGEYWDEFQPLDAFGTPNAGATRIDYYNEETEEWETL